MGKRSRPWFHGGPRSAIHRAHLRPMARPYIRPARQRIHALSISMIRSKEDLHFYLAADRFALGLPHRYGAVERIKQLVFPNFILRFQRTLRKLEYRRNCGRGPVSRLLGLCLAFRYHWLGARLGFSIPLNVFGPGLAIAHYGTIIVNGNARVGANCRLHAGVNIGTEAGNSGSAPVLGDNCYIGPGAKLFGPVRIADGIAIGANAVVNRSFETPRMAIAGVPARELGPVDTLDLVIPATHIVARGLHTRKDIAGASAMELKALLQHDPDIYG